MASPEAFQKNIEALRAAIPELRAVLIGSTEGLSIAHLDRGWRRSGASGGDGRTHRSDGRGGDEPGQACE